MEGECVVEDGKARSRKKSLALAGPDETLVVSQRRCSDVMMRLGRGGKSSERSCRNRQTGDREAVLCLNALNSQQIS